MLLQLDLAPAKRDIRKLSADELKEFMVAHGEKPFRAKQVSEWLWKNTAGSFEQMNNISLATRELLARHFVINGVQVQSQQLSQDGTIKSAFRLHDGNVVEGVLIPHDTRMTACISSQVGCSLTCKFCATGYLERKRNLDAAEIYDQVVRIREQCEIQYGLPLTNIVYMGMGEPLLNYANVVESVRRITAPDGLNMAPRRITISTAGIAKMIKRLADDEVKANLALSLHAPTDAKRNEIMPINEANSLWAARIAAIRGMCAAQPCPGRGRRGHDGSAECSHPPGPCRLGVERAQRGRRDGRLVWLRRRSSHRHARVADGVRCVPAGRLPSGHAAGLGADGGADGARAWRACTRAGVVRVP